MKNFNIYTIGVGGQGIGLLSEVVIRACDYGGFKVSGVDTHGLAQRGGTVISQIRIGEGIYTPLIQEHSADLVVALERNEALRGLNTHLKDGGTLIYYNAIWQPLAVRMKKSEQMDTNIISEECKLRGIKEIQIFKEDLEDSKMQNVVILGEIAVRNLVPGVKKEHYELALKDLLDGNLLEENLKLFNSIFQ